MYVCFCMWICVKVHEVCSEDKSRRHVSVFQLPFFVWCQNQDVTCCKRIATICCTVCSISCHHFLLRQRYWLCQSLQKDLHPRCDISVSPANTNRSFFTYFPFKFCWIPTGPMLFASTSLAYFQSGLYINFIAFFNPFIIITVISTMYEMNCIKFHKCQIQPILRKRNIVLNKAFSSFPSKGDHYCEMNGCTCSVEYIYFPEPSFVFSLCFSALDVRFIADQYLLFRS